MTTTHDVEQALEDSNIVYRHNNKWYIGLNGDSDVTDTVESLIERLTD